MVSFDWQCRLTEVSFNTYASSNDYSRRQCLLWRVLCAQKSRMSSSIRAALPPGIPATRTRVEQEILKAIDAASEAQKRKRALWRLALFYHEQAKRSDLAVALLELMIQEFSPGKESKRKSIV